MPKQPVDDVATRRLQQSFPVVSFRTWRQETETHTQGDENTHRETKDCIYEVVFHFSTLLKITSKVRFIFFNTKFFSKNLGHRAFLSQSMFINKTFSKRQYLFLMFGREITRKHGITELRVAVVQVHYRSICICIQNPCNSQKR
jgi:hypothetical protein